MAAFRVAVNISVQLLQLYFAELPNPLWQLLTVS